MRKPVPTPEAEERTLPANLEAERSILGAILTHNDAFEMAASIVKPSQFYRLAHQQIFAAMVSLKHAKIVVDFVTLKEELTRAGQIQDVGGAAYIASLADGVPRGTNVRYYASIVAEKATLRDLIDAGNKIVTAAYEAEAPASVLLSEADRALLALHGTGASQMRSLSDTMPQRFDALEWRVAHKGELRGVTTGYASIDLLTLGLRAGDLIIIAARPSIGKTTLTLNMAVHAGQATRLKGPGRYRIGVFSLEMTRDQLEDRIHSQISRVPLSRIQNGHIGGTEWEPLANALQTMQDLPLSIDDRSGQTAIDIRHGCRRLLAEHGALDMVIVDYVQLMPGCLARKGATRTEELSDAATRLKDLAKELSIPVVLLSQLRRLDGRPKIEDLRECGTLEQVADLVGLLHRKDHRVSGTTEFILAKQRNGPTGTVNLTLDRDTTTFHDGGEDLPEPTAEEKKETAKRSRARAFVHRASW